ncbi:hypothetical protein I4U23_031503 [Adineta vaga]|nr:hypothetical protein I4U23_031503 [Adineta vaga]
MFSSSTLLFLVVVVVVTLLLLDPITSAKEKHVLQTGGHTMQKGTATALNKEFNKNLHPREWGRKLEKMKENIGLENDHHGKIWSNGDYTDMDGNFLGNFL